MRVRGEREVDGVEAGRGTRIWLDAGREEGVLRGLGRGERVGRRRGAAAHDDFT